MSNVSLVDGHIDEPKMTDEQILKALECCTYSLGVMCKKCPSKTTLQGLGCRNKLSIATLDLIKRKDAEIDILKAEIERLNKILENRGEICKLCEGKYTGKIKRAKAKAIKEFAERLKEKSYLNDGVVYIDDLVKEMVGD